jgi:CSLREA domain-containing protein
LARVSPAAPRLAIVMFAALVALLGLPGAFPVAAAGIAFVPTRFDDPPPDACDPSDCSLREAIIAANGSAGADAISLSPGTYELTVPGTPGDAATGDLNISGELTIGGAGASTTFVSATSLGDRVFNLASDATVTLSGLTITNATSGAMLNSGTLTARGIAVSMNSTDPASPGGGIQNSGTLTMTDSTLNGNRAGTDGGGIFNSGTMTLANVTMSSNRGDRGGGIFNLGTAVLLSSTVARNTAFVGGGGGVFADPAGTFRLTNTIVANNIDSAIAALIPDCAGTVLSGGYNLVEDVTGCAGVHVSGDVTGLDPKLGTLTDNGGPTATQAPATDSPAIDAGNPASPGSGGASCTGTDQRGTPRDLGGRCDIGAVEQVLCMGTPVRRIGTEGHDTLLGTMGSDAILGLGGDDAIDASGGSDKVCSGDGNDIVTAGSGDDQVRGEAGNDQLRGDFGKDVLAGADGADILDGGSGDDLLSGGSGDDVLTGGSGTDRVMGDDGTDGMSGDSGPDELLGGSGTDILRGGTGRDRCRGGPGTDRLKGCEESDGP